MAKIKLRINARGEATWRFPPNMSPTKAPTHKKVQTKGLTKEKVKNDHRVALAQGTAQWNAIQSKASELGRLA